MSGIGRLRHRLVLEAPAESPDGSGGADVTWNAVATVWAEIAPLSGRETLKAETVTAEATHRIAIRRRAVSPAMRFVGGGRIFEILAVLDDERRWRTRCLCRERL